MPVRFHFQSVFNLRNRKKIKQFLPVIFKKEKTGVEELDIVICDNAYLLAINQQYLNHDYYTDIITFDLSQDLSAPKVGEIYISIEMVKQNAIEYKMTTHEELLRVIFHGALHLCGYKDKSSKDIAQMRKKESIYLAMFHGEH